MKVKELGRRHWKKESGYHRQDLVENTFFRYKTTIGPELRARHPQAQEAEAIIACNVLNRMIVIGRPESLAIADQRKSGKQRIRSRDLIYAPTPVPSVEADPIPRTPRTPRISPGRPETFGAHAADSSQFSEAICSRLMTTSATRIMPLAISMAVHQELTPGTCGGGEKLMPGSLLTEFWMTPVVTT
jgi:hypothetical protein